MTPSTTTKRDGALHGAKATKYCTQPEDSGTLFSESATGLSVVTQSDGPGRACSDHEHMIDDTNTTAHSTTIRCLGCGETFSNWHEIARHRERADHADVGEVYS